MTLLTFPKMKTMTNGFEVLPFMFTLTFRYPSPSPTNSTTTLEVLLGTISIQTVIELAMPLAFRTRYIVRMMLRLFHQRDVIKVGMRR